MKIEVKLGGKHFGRLLPYGDLDPRLTIGQIAIDYITDPTHADYFALSAVRLGSRGRGAGKRPGELLVVIYSRQQVLDAVLAFLATGTSPSLCVHNGGIAIGRIEYTKMRQTFGAPVAEYSTGLQKIDDVQPDAGCPNAPYARAWEKICAKVLGGRWVGGLRNVQVDIIINENDD